MMMSDAGIGAGLESMTTNPMAWEGSVNPAVLSLTSLFSGFFNWLCEVFSALYNVLCYRR